MSSSKEVVRILSIDGGGIRGILPLSILKYIEKETQAPIHELFDVIGGTSTGGIIALGLNSKKRVKNEVLDTIYTTQEILDFYVKEAHQIFVKTGDDWALQKPRYSDKDIEIFLKQKLGDETKLSELPTKCNVTVYSYDIENDEVYPFNNKEEASNHHFVWQAARATSAAPTYFPSLEISDSNSRFEISKNISPALTVYQNKLYMAWRKDDEGIYYSYFDGKNWSAQERVIDLEGNKFGISQESSPALAVYQNKLYMAWRGAGGDGQKKIYYASFDGKISKWLEQHQASKFEISKNSSPALVVNQDKLYMAWRKDDEGIYYASFDGENWSAEHRSRSFGISQESSPALAADQTQTKLYMAWRGAGGDGQNKIYYACFSDANWSMQKIAPSFKTLVDGGIFINNPAMDLFIRAKHLYPDAKQFLLVSLGTGNFLESHPELKSAGLTSWLRPLISYMMKGVSITVDDQLKNLLGNSSDSIKSSLQEEHLYYRFEPEFQENIAMDAIEEPDIKRLQELAEKFVEDKKSDIDRLVHQLKLYL